MTTTIKKQKHYINNPDFLQALMDYKAEQKRCKKDKLPDPPIPNYIGECFMKIAEGLSDGIENCLMYFDNFDPSKSKNPFAYFTQIIYYAFLRRIQKEKKQLYVKYKATEQMGILDEFEMLEFEDGTTRQFELYENISEFIENYEDAKKAKKEVKKPKGIEKFLGE